MTATKTPFIVQPTRLCPQCQLCSTPADTPDGTLCAMCARHDSRQGAAVVEDGDRPALRYQDTPPALAGRARAAATVATNKEAA